MKIPGADLMVFITVGGKKVSCALATSHTLDLTMNTVDTSTKDNGNGRWQDNEPGLRSWSISTDNLVSDGTDQGATIDDLIALIISGEKVDLAFGLQGDKDYTTKEDEDYDEAPEGGWTPDTKGHYTGKALVTAVSVSGQNGERATYNATFTGCGALKPVGNGIAVKKAAAVSLSAGSGVKVSTASAASSAK